MYKRHSKGGGLEIRQLIQKTLQTLKELREHFINWFPKVLDVLTMYIEHVYIYEQALYYLLYSGQEMMLFV